MANLDYYAHEVDALLRQVNVNRNNIGMNNVNVLPLPDGVISPSYDYAPNVVIVECSREDGTITVTLDGTIESSLPRLEYQLARLTLDGENADGKILPGIYNATDFIHQISGDIETGSTGIQILVSPSSGESTYDIYWCRDTYDEFSKVTIPENLNYVLILLLLDIDDEYGKVKTVSGSARFAPMLSLIEHGEPPFEPYKPDLQTQIDNLAERVTELEEHGGGRSPVLQTANITNKAQSLVKEVEQ